MLPGVGCSDAARSPAHVPLYLPAPRGATDPHQTTDRPTGPRSLPGCSPAAQEHTRDRFHRFYPRDDFTGSTCVPCVKTVELERPPICWVKSAPPLKSHEPSNRRINHARVADAQRVTAVAAAVLDQLAPAPARTHTQTHTLSHIWHYINTSELCARHSSCCNPSPRGCARASGQVKRGRLTS